MIQIIVFALTLLTSFNEISSECEPNKVVFTMVVSKQIASLNQLLAKFNKTYINMSKMKFDVSEEIEADGVKLFDITQTAPGDTYIWTAPESTEFAKIILGLNTSTLEINSLQFKGSKYNNAKVTVNDAFMTTTQITKFMQYACIQSYEKFEFFPVTKALINSDTDVTEDFNKIVVPWINKQIESKEFKDLVEKYFTNVCNEESLRELNSLITSPYSN